MLQRLIVGLPRADLAARLARILWLSAIIFMFFSSDLSLDQHVSRVCAASFYRLRQFSRISKSLNPRQPLCTPSWRHALITATLFMLCHRRRSPTRYKGRWTRPLEFSVTLVNVIVDWRQYYTTSSTGWMYTTGLNASLVWWGVRDRAPRYLADHLVSAFHAAPRRLRLQPANMNRLTVPCCRLST